MEEHDAETQNYADGNLAATGVTFPQANIILSVFQDLEYDEERRRFNKIGLPTSFLGWLVSFFTFLCIILTLIGATHGLGFLGFKVTKDNLNGGEIIALILCIIFFAYAEGYAGFMKSWSPVTARRCLLVGTLLSSNHIVKSLFIILLSPLFACGFFWAPRRRILISYLLVAMILLLVVAVRNLTSPWHEIVDCGVAVGLGTGTLSFLYFYVQAILKKELPPDIDYAYTSGTSTDLSAPLLN